MVFPFFPGRVKNAPRTPYPVPPYPFDIIDILLYYSETTTAVHSRRLVKYTICPAISDSSYVIPHAHSGKVYVQHTLTSSRTHSTVIGRLETPRRESSRKNPYLIFILGEGGNFLKCAGVHSILRFHTRKGHQTAPSGKHRRSQHLSRSETTHTAHRVQNRIFQPVGLTRVLVSHTRSRDFSRLD